MPIECLPIPDRSTRLRALRPQKSLNQEQVSVPCERRPIPKNRGGARSDRADTGRLPGENEKSGGLRFGYVTAPLPSPICNIFMFFIQSFDNIIV